MSLFNPENARINKVTMDVLMQRPIDRESPRVF